jgi:hypothetical protein
MEITPQSKDAPLEKPQLLRDATNASMVKRNKSKILSLLSKLQDAIHAEDLERPASAIVIVTLGPDGPNIHYQGLQTLAEVNEVSHIVRDAYWGSRWNGNAEDFSVQEHVVKEWQRRIESHEASEQWKADKRAETPWRCEFCDKGYKTQRGAEQHETAQKKLGCIHCGIPRCQAKSKSFDYERHYRGEMTCGECLKKGRS